MYPTVIQAFVGPTGSGKWQTVCEHEYKKNKPTLREQDGLV
jgi:hypothetical protein